MHVVGHNNPCEQTAQAIIIVEKNFFHTPGNRWDSHFTRSVTSVEIFFEPNPPHTLIVDAED
jgi:hypothetical protein